MRRFLLAALPLLIVAPAIAAEKWETLPPTPAPLATGRSGKVHANGVDIHHAIYGHGSPVMFLHGGLANTDYWGKQVPVVARHRTEHSRSPHGMCWRAAQRKPVRRNVDK